MKVFGKNVFNEMKNDIKSIKRIYLAHNFNDNEILSFIKDKKISYSFMDLKAMDKMVEGKHQGIIMVVDDYEYADYKKMLNDKVVVMLDHLEDPHNLGAIIRTVEASGIDGIILPKNRSVSVNETVMKTSVGALYNVNICQVTNLNQTISKLKELGFWIIGTDMNASNYQDINYPEKSALIIGSEGFGMSRLVKESCDYVVSIPMYGKINSLNASVAAGIMIYELIRKR